MTLWLIVCVLFTSDVNAAQGSTHRPGRSGTPMPHTVDEAAKLLKTQWLSEKDRDWILRNPKADVVATLHLPFGTAVRNSFKLWGGNPELLASCGTTEAEECSGIIFERLWTSVREDADPKLLPRLDCQFRLTEEIKIDYKGFYALRIGEVLERVQDQIDRQLANYPSELRADCGGSLRLRPAGDPNLQCWTRAEFSEDGEGPVSLGRFLGWISWRNGFGVLHSPPEIRLPFHEKCSWPEQPPQFRPPKAHEERKLKKDSSEILPAGKLLIQHQDPCVADRFLPFPCVA